jgi:pimeloyl-ACP methyl ester carboxylesterase
VAPLDAWLAKMFGDTSAVLIRENQYSSGTPIVYVNGVLTSRADNETTARRIARLFDVPVYSVWNPTTGSLIGDGAELFFVNKRNVLDASTLKVILAIRDILLAKTTVTLMAHSQGAAIASSALSYLSNEERAKVDVVTLGGAAYSYPTGARSLRVIANVQDLVPWLFGYLGRSELLPTSPQLDQVSFGRLRVWSLEETHSILEYLDVMEQALRSRRIKEQVSRETKTRLMGVPALGRGN